VGSQFGLLFQQTFERPDGDVSIGISLLAFRSESKNQLNADLLAPERLRSASQAALVPRCFFQMALWGTEASAADQRQPKDLSIPAQRC